MGDGGGGALDGGSPCRVSILRNANVECRLFIPMSHVEFKKLPCRMSNLRNGPRAIGEFIQTLDEK